MQRNLFSTIKENFIKIITSRLFVLVIILFSLGSILIHRVFELQIVNGQTYLDNFQLKIQKERNIYSTRGNIYDRNGKLLAYNELAYSVTIEDVYESGRNKNALLNETVYKTIKIIEDNNDEIISDFNIILNEAGEYEFKVSDTALLRFLADVYGYSKIESLKYAEKTSSAEDVINYMASSKYYSISEEYSKEEILKIITIRYAMSANSYQKYISTTIATGVSEKTVAVIMENSNELPGVNIAEGTVRRYVDSMYFSSIIGYTGKISAEELKSLNEQNNKYTTTDMVGKTGIERSMESELQGTKGSQTVFVDNLGRVIEITETIEPEAGKDIYLTIDKDLQIATYNILEQKIAGILVSKIDNIKEYVPGTNASQSKIRIPIYDVYVALFDNNVIKLKTLKDEEASETTQEVYNNILKKNDAVMKQIRDEMLNGKTAYRKLNKEMKAYESYIVALLQSDNVGIIDKKLIDTSDEVYKAWKTEETICIKEYLKHAITKNWINIEKLKLDTQYADTEEIYTRLVDVVIEKLRTDNDFAKIVIKYMIMNNELSGKQICMILCEESIVEVSDEVYNNLSKGKLKPYKFMIDRISNLDITPAQLALDPCSGSIVITDVNTGDVLALVTYPSYDNNKLANSIDAAYYSDLLNDASKPLWNYATQQTSAPGSTFKMVTAAAALEEGLISPKTKIICNGIFDTLAPTIYKCWINPGRHNSITVQTAIAKSCNSFFYELGYRLSTVNTAYDSKLGLKMLEKYAEMFGLTDKSGVEISESEPKVSDAYSVVSAIGQGTNDFTTTGLARYVTTIANDGVCYNLTLIDKINDADGNLIKDNKAEIRNIIEFKENTWKVLHQGMKEVIEGKDYFDNFGITVAGKTGTAQESTLRPTHALFVCYAPFEKPEIAVATRIAFGYSSDYAAETAKSVLMYYFELEEEEVIIDGQASEMESAGITTD